MFTFVGSGLFSGMEYASYGIEPEEHEPCNYYALVIFSTSTYVSPSDASSGVFFFQFVGCFLLAGLVVSRAFPSLLRPFPLVAMVFGHATCARYMYATVYRTMLVIGLVSWFVEFPSKTRFRLFFTWNTLRFTAGKKF